MEKILLAKIIKKWQTCIECPFNYDGIDCKLFEERYRDDYIDAFDPYKETPKWCRINTIECYEVKDDDD